MPISDEYVERLPEIYRDMLAAITGTVTPTLEVEPFPPLHEWAT